MYLELIGAGDKVLFTRAFSLFPFLPLFPRLLVSFVSFFWKISEQKQLANYSDS